MFPLLILSPQKEYKKYFLFFNKKINFFQFGRYLYKNNNKN